MASTYNNVQRLETYNSLRPGDYAVHPHYGIGKYLGLKPIRVSGRYHDYLVLEYRHHARVYVPAEKSNLVQKYLSAGERHPRLSALDSSSWRHTKRRVRKKTVRIADGLVKLYAKRKVAKGYAYEKDTPAQRMFEQAFPYRMTPDQERSTKEIKADMEKPYPMDRLLVGDVGYGKTEVALRAAFKAMDAGKQVAMLVPTSILAIQHCETMIKRFDRFPIRIGIISGLNDPKNTANTIKMLKSGRLDIVIGTHRILSEDVRFKDLGLLIIDEEQRFGVKAKNIIKARYPKIDVLTLTATPIPRTLNMATMGVRDLSIIETPPVDRKPIITKVLPENWQIIKAGIQDELKRDGQVYFLHNRVKDIQETATRIKRLVPKARVAYINGRMDKRDLERTLFAFANRRFDVLVTTTIIETGIDLSNVNTIFVERADKMGLAQLYQLRGRVGRSNRQAYAYLMYRRSRNINDTSIKRLQTMRRFNALGSGFHIAMHDLLLRGSGTLLGNAQHGFINSVGYNMYTRMISREVAKKKGRPKYQMISKDVNLNQEAYLPTTYLPGSSQRLKVYQRLNRAAQASQLEQLSRKLTSEHGPQPQAVKNLFLTARLELIIKPSVITQIDCLPKRVTLTIDTKPLKRYSRDELIKPVVHQGFRVVTKSIGKELGLDLNTPSFILNNLSWIKAVSLLARRLDRLVK